MLLLLPLPEPARGLLDTIRMCLGLLPAPLGRTGPWAFEARSCWDGVGRLVGIPVLASLMLLGTLLMESVPGTAMSKSLLLVTGSERDLCLPL